MIVMESLRLYPPIWAMSRTVSSKCEIGGYELEPGNFVFMSQWVMHRDPRFFEVPEIFNPERWAGDLAKRLPSFAYFPFGGGPRVCIGKSFALMESVLILATLAQQFRITLVPGYSVTPWPAFTLRPKNGLKMRLTKR
jgi:cytochrome P450